MENKFVKIDKRTKRNLRKWMRYFVDRDKELETIKIKKEQMRLFLTLYFSAFEKGTGLTIQRIEFIRLDTNCLSEPRKQKQIIDIGIITELE